MKAKLLRRLRREANEKYDVQDVWMNDKGIYMVIFRGRKYYKAVKTNPGAFLIDEDDYAFNNLPPYPTRDEVKDAIIKLKREYIARRVKYMRHCQKLPEIRLKKQQLINQLNN